MAPDPALGIGNPAAAPELAAGLYARLSGRKGAGLPAGLRKSGMPSTGRPKMLVLLIEFDEYPARPGDTAEAMAARIFGSAGQFPYESLTAYYRRASYARLNIEGDVLGWYKAGPRAEIPNTWQGREAVIKKALQSYGGQDLSRYDNNGDGVIDYLAVIWTGPIGSWATFWWGAAPTFADTRFRVSGMRLGSYSWQGVVSDWSDPAAEFKVNTLIHETGHAMGLPDYYDYKPGVGPDGGLGYLDMMDSTKYDHNCFSKLLLGWVEPKVVTLGGEFRLPPASGAGDCLLLVPPGRAAAAPGEFFLVENRRKSGNDADYSFVGGGLVVWHVDARLNAAGKNFLYNNQDTEHKLLKALEADGLEELEKGLSKRFSVTDFYTNGRTLGADTVPSSRLYDGADTGIRLFSRGGDLDAALLIGLN